MTEAEINEKFSLENNIKSARSYIERDLGELNEEIIRNYKRIEKLEIDLAYLNREKRKLEKREKDLQELRRTLVI